MLCHWQARINGREGLLRNGMDSEEPSGRVPRAFGTRLDLQVGWNLRDFLLNQSWESETKRQDFHYGEQPAVGIVRPMECLVRGRQSIRHARQFKQDRGTQSNSTNGEALISGLAVISHIDG